MPNASIRHVCTRCGAWKKPTWERNSFPDPSSLPKQKLDRERQLKQELDRERQAKKRKADDEDMHGVSEPVNTVDGVAEPAKSLRKRAK